MNINLAKFSHYKKVSKLWGTEYWLTNVIDIGYCAKFLEVLPGFKCSLHCHKAKTETFFVLTGRVRLEMIGLDGQKSEFVLEEGEHVMVYPNEYHRFSSASVSESVLILEVSSFHDDADVYRLEDSRAIEC